MFDFTHDENCWRESEDSVAYFVSERARAQRDIAKRVEQIVAGQLYPSVSALLDGMPPFSDDLRADIDVFVARSRAIAGIPERLRDDLRDFGVWPSADAAIRVFDGASALPIDDDQSLASVQRRAAWYGALFGVPRLRDALYCAHRSIAHRHLCYRMGLEFGSHVLSSAADWTPRYQEDVSAVGFLTLRRVASIVDMTDWMRVNDDACFRFTSGKLQRSELFALANPIASSAERLAEVEKNIVAATTLINDATARKAFERSGEDAYGNVENDDQRLAAVLADMKDPKLRVIAKLPESGTADQKTFAKGFSVLADRGTKLVVAQNVADIATDLARAWPHAADVVHRILADVVQGRAIRMRPILLVGSHGSGKTTLLNAIVRRLGLASVVFPCASVSDGSFGGTPAQWHSRRVSTPLQLIRTSGIANPAVILDELEKTGSSTQNGSLVHALLPMLERHSASSYFETALEIPVDLSGVVFLATANDLSALPDPLRDRFRVIAMPDATIEHLPDLAASIAIAVSEERGVPAALQEDLAPDELDVIGQVWGGGSLRKLRSAVEATLDLRDRVAVRQ